MRRWLLMQVFASSRSLHKTIGSSRYLVKQFARPLTSQAATAVGAVYLRIDTIEQAIRDSGVLKGGVGRSGYSVANALAFSNLQLGCRVIADCVNPVRESREAWQATAERAGANLLNVHVICSDAQEHRRRVETRQPPNVAPAPEDLLDHVLFALKHEGINLSILAQALPRISASRCHEPGRMLESNKAWFPKPI